MGLDHAMNAEASRPATDAGASQGHIIVGIGGGIAAYKACHIIRAFTTAGDAVIAIPTPRALNFIGSATLEALTGHRVSTSVFEGVDKIQHVSLGQNAQGIVIAPATADLLARLAAGRADDLLTSTVLMATCPVVIAPAMHTQMWLNPATQDNVATLRRRGYVVLNPESGRLTGADSGPGRLPEPEHIVALARAAFAGKDLSYTWVGTKVLITAGGTQENVDPVRYLGNRSSGHQGYALAAVAAARGAEVTLVAGATESLATPPGVTLVRISSARDMAAEVEARTAHSDVVIMAAAVADYRPATQAAVKLKKGTDDTELEQIRLVKNPDILQEAVQRRACGDSPAHQVIVGFAAETGSPEHSVLELGQEKLRRKGCDLLMVNEVGEGKTFGQPTNSGWLLKAEFSETLQKDSLVSEAGNIVFSRRPEVIPVAEAEKVFVAADILCEVDSCVRMRKGNLA